MQLLQDEAIANVVSKCCKCSIKARSIDMQRGLPSSHLVSLSPSLSLPLPLSFYVSLSLSLYLPLSLSLSFAAYSSLPKAATETGQGGGPTLGAS